MFKWSIEQKLDHVNPRPLNWPKSSLGQRKSPFIYKDYAILITLWNSLSQASTSRARTPTIFWLSSVWIDVLLRGRMEKTQDHLFAWFCIVFAQCVIRDTVQKDMNKKKVSQDFSSISSITSGWSSCQSNVSTDQTTTARAAINMSFPFPVITI